MKIVAIGGGKLALKQTLAIDRVVVDLVGRKRPRALFIPTASGDDEEYEQSFRRTYADELGCKVDCLKLLYPGGDRSNLKKRILAADLIYVGGGNTLRMMKLWRKLGVDRMLRTAGNQGTVLAGLSAGAICWHRWGHSDSMSFSSEEAWSYVRVRSLGFLPHLFCPHLDGEKRHDSLVEMLGRYRNLTVACNNNAAIYYDGTRATCITSRTRARTHVYRPVAGGLEICKYRDGETVEL